MQARIRAQDESCFHGRIQEGGKKKDAGPEDAWRGCCQVRPGPFGSAREAWAAHSRQPVTLGSSTAANPRQRVTLGFNPAAEAKTTLPQEASPAAESRITSLEKAFDKRITTLEEKVDSLTPMVASLDGVNKMVIATQNGVAPAILTDHDNLHYDDAILKRTTNLTALSQDKILSADAHRHDCLEQLEDDIRSLSIAGRRIYAATKALTVHVGDSSGCTERGVEEHGKGADGVGWKSVRLSCWETSHMKGIIRVKHSSLSATKKRAESSPPPVVLANICSSRQDAFWAVFAPVKSWRSVGRGLR